VSRQWPASAPGGLRVLACKPLDNVSNPNYVGSTLGKRVPIPDFWFRFEEVSMKFRPLHDRVLIRRVEGEEKTAGGIIIPDTAKEKPMEGEVVAAGPGARGDDGKLQPMDVKAGGR